MSEEQVDTSRESRSQEMKPQGTDGRRQEAPLRRVGTIRVRLIATSVALVLLVAAAVGVGSILVGLYNARQQAYRQLESVVTLKTRQIDTWLKDLQFDLDAFFTEEYEMTRMRTVLLWLELMNPRDAQTTLRLGLERQIERAHRFGEVFLVNLQGEVVLSTYREREGQNYAAEEFFESGLQSRYVQPPMYDTLTGQTVIYFCRPAIDLYGNTLGVLVARTGLDRLNEICLERSGLGETGETYLVDAGHTVVTALRHPARGGTALQIGEFVRSKGVDMALFARGSGADVYEGYHGENVLGSYMWIPDLRVALMAEQELGEVTAGARMTVIINAGVVLASALAAVVGAFFVSRGISEPLAALSRTATQIAAGDLSLVVEADRHDEIGTLARSFNSMTVQLRDLVGSLEQRVAEATRNLEAAAEVSRATTSLLDPETLQRQVVDTVQERFGLYYVGLFLADEAGQYALLRAGTGEAGRQMVAQGHRLAIGGDSMIGQCVSRNRLMVLQSTADRAVRFDNPLLPHTRSELALPMRAAGRVIGAMTVQSSSESAFDEQYISTLQTVADQVAAALTNARLFQQVEETLEVEQRVRGELTREAWADLIRERPDLGFLSDARGTAAAGDTWDEEMIHAVQTGKTAAGDGDTKGLAVPVKTRGQVVAVIDAHLPDDAGEWTPEQRDLLETLADQLGVALESAQLYLDAQRRAAREQTTREITDRMRGAVDMDELLQTAIQETAAVLGASRAFVQWVPSERVDDENERNTT
jgi:GAF domain-containing protein/HAMP domain-containing protein